MVEFKKVKSKFIIYILVILVSLPLEVIVLPYYIVSQFHQKPNHLFNIICIFVVCVGFLKCLNYWRFKIGTQIQNVIYTESKKKMMTQIIQVYKSQRKDLPIGKFINHMENIPYIIEQIFYKGISYFIPECISVLSLIVFLFWVHPILGAISIGYIIFIFFIIKTLVPPLLHTARKEYDYRSTFNQSVHNTLENFVYILVNNSFDFEKTNFRNKVDQHYKRFQKCEVANNQYYKGMDISSIVFFAILSFVLFKLIRLQPDKATRYTSVFVVLLFFLDKLEGFKFMLAQISAFLYKSQVYLKDINILIPPHSRELSTEKELPIHLSQDNALEMRNITYQYPTSKTPLFHHRTFTFPKHQLTAIQGPSGCGKSTLAKLAIGLIDNQQGHIFIQQQDITSDYSKRQSYIAYLPQNVKLFDGNVLDNIRYTCQHQYSKSQIDKWIRKYNLHDILMKNSNDHEYLERNVGLSGNHLSGGQRQLIVLLRTFITNECRKVPKTIFILDEPTSALDKHTGQIVLNWLKQLTKQYTIIVITHDPKIAKQCSHHIEI